ncbi:hypothetical protein HYFRA_00005251 [Hymenoscyphus fraxineus]|uniref:Heterokaryon incompatibility domain-containing protein n=1 Tax=Hymenoscyphus fraxineus TaxID=746836 RepID=A0A9N9LAS0_9HELO|nr:hypothetical protein HYFRA_00005251 [Hymenoscyphus fraxineus]
MPPKPPTPPPHSVDNLSVVNSIQQLPRRVVNVQPHSRTRTPVVLHTETIKHESDNEDRGRNRNICQQTRVASSSPLVNREESPATVNSNNHRVPSPPRRRNLRRAPSLPSPNSHYEVNLQRHQLPLDMNPFAPLGSTSSNNYPLYPSPRLGELSKPFHHLDLDPSLSSRDEYHNDLSVYGNPRVELPEYQAPRHIVGSPPSPVYTATTRDIEKRAHRERNNPQSVPRPWFQAAVPYTSAGFISGISRPPTSISPRVMSYQYQALQDLEFRLVKILPKTAEQTVRCEIIHASLIYPPQYAAISYTWGDASDTRKIELNGFPLSIGANLHGALYAVGEKTGDTLVWVDALCIDQQNTNEKTIQIPLMAQIYSRADFVAVWLGPEDDDSDAAIDLLRRLHRISEKANHPSRISSLISSQAEKGELAAVVSLFEREYWSRLWVVQEIYNAKHIAVYCGSKRTSWQVYQHASKTFRQHKADIEYHFPGGRRDRRRNTHLNKFSYSQVLAFQGPSSLSNIEYLDEGSLLDVLRACRNKMASKPQDKLFGILGILPPETRDLFRPDESRSVKDVYMEIVDYLVTTTRSLDVICDAIHFPAHTSSETLPSYVPDWSHIPSVAALGQTYKFSASGNRRSKHQFNERKNKIEFEAIYIDTIGIHGIAVGTLCTLADYLMAFIHWRALLLGSIQNESKEVRLSVQGAFCNVLSLGQIPAQFGDPAEWSAFCYHMFASLLRERLPCLQLDDELLGYSETTTDPSERRESLQTHLGSKMMGRCFFRTEDGMIGMGSGAMIPGDIVVVPLGCSTPVLLREEGTTGEYRFVGDVYLNEYMHGRAVAEVVHGKREVMKYLLH